MKFFSTDKKPSLRNLVIVTVLMIIAELVIFLCLGSKGAYACGYLFEYYMISLWVMLFVAAKRQLNYNPYSHNTIMYIGFGIYVLVNSIVNAIVLIQLTSNPEIMDIINIVGFIVGTLSYFSFFIFPILSIFSIALAISNIELIRKEGYRFVNALGLLLSFLIIGGFLILYRLTYYISGSQFEVFMADLFYNLLYGIYTYFLCMLMGSMITNLIVSHHMPEPDKGFILILGCGMNSDGTPTPLLRSRIDRAIEFADYQYRKTGKEIRFIPSGGQGSDEIISESQCMKNYLMSKGISEDRIIMEDRSTTTAENMRFSREIIERTAPEEKAAYATNNYHVLRSGMFAVDNGLKAEGIGARTKWYFWPNAAVREFVGMISRHKLMQAIILLSIVAFYSFLIWFETYGYYLYILRP